jgi:hypothetical protein
VTEQPEAASLTPEDGQQPDAADAPTTGWAPHTAAGASTYDSGTSSAASVAERPEVMVGAAFAAGLLSAMILKRFAR